MSTPTQTQTQTQCNKCTCQKKPVKIVNIQVSEHDYKRILALIEKDNKRRVYHRNYMRKRAKVKRHLSKPKVEEIKILKVF